MFLAAISPLAGTARLSEIALLGEIGSGTLWVVFAGTVLIAAAILARSFIRPTISLDDAKGEAESEAAEKGMGGRVALLEVRLHDFAREVEARLETRAIQLDQLVLEADREIVRLTQLLKSGGSPRQSSGPDLIRFGEPGKATAGTSDPRQAASAGVAPVGVAPVGVMPVGAVPVGAGVKNETVYHLRDAGYGVPEIAQIVGLSADEVRLLSRAA